MPERRELRRARARAPATPRRAPRTSATCARRRCATTCPCAAPTPTASSPCTNGPPCGATPCGRSSPAAWRWCHRAGTSRSTLSTQIAVCACTPSCRAATPRVSTRPCGWRSSRPRPAWARWRSTWRPTATARSWPRRSDPAPSTAWAWRCSRWACRRPARPPRPPTPAPWRGTSASSGLSSRRPAEPGPRTSTSCWSWPRRSPCRDSAAARRGWQCSPARAATRPSPPTSANGWASRSRRWRPPPSRAFASSCPAPPPWATRSTTPPSSGGRSTRSATSSRSRARIRRSGASSCSTTSRWASTARPRSRGPTCARASTGARRPARCP